MKTFYKLCLITALTFATAQNNINAQCNTIVEAGNDTSICAPGGDVQLMGQVTGNYEFVEWAPTTGLSNPGILNPIANVTATTTFTLTAYGYSNVNLIVNGDFEQGNTGFTSEYTHSPTNLVPEGVYAVLPDASAVHPNFPACVDHTLMDGTGNMMAINGSNTPNTEVWCQTITVQPNTLYEFNTWVLTLVSNSPAILQFSVNGNLLGAPFNAPTSTCNWQQFNENWFSGSNTSVEICIVNQNTATAGNDFALDDISFFEYCEQSDSITVEVLPPTESFVDEYICEGDCFFIGNIAYCNGGSYMQTLPGANSNGCDSTVNLTLSVLNPQAAALPAEPLSCHNNFQTVVDGSPSSFGISTTYLWTGPNGFSSIDINPFVTEPGNYQLNVTMTEGGVSCTDSVIVVVDILDNIPISDAGSDDTLNCKNNSILLDGSASNAGNGAQISFEWQDTNGFPIAFTPTVNTDMLGTYLLIITDNQSGCSDTSQVTIYEDFSIPVFNAVADSLSCADTLATLQAVADSQQLSYLWRGPNMQTWTDSVIQSSVSGQYTLVATAENGCKDSLEINVFADTLRPVFSLVDTAVITCIDTAILLDVGVDSNLYDFLWTLPDGSVDSVTAISTTQFGQHSLRLTAENGCSEIEVSEIIPDTISPEFTLMGDTLDCLDTVGTVSAQSGDNNLLYFWSGPDGFQDTGQLVNVYSAGTYTAIATSANGCSSLKQVSVVPSLDIPDLSASGGVIDCNIDSVVLQSSSQSAGAVAGWTGPNGFSSSEWNPTVHVGGEYTVTVLLPNGCKNDTIVLVELDTIAPTIIVADSIFTCAIQAISPQYVVDSSTQLLQWLGPNAYFYEGNDPVLFSPGQYTATAIGINGCSHSFDFQMSADTMLPVASLTIDTIDCIQTSQAFMGTYLPDSVNVLWSGPQSFSSIEKFPVVDIIGSYSLHLIDAGNGCRDSFEYTVDADTALPLTAATADTITCANTIANLSATSITDNVQFSWSSANGFLSNQADTTTTANGMYKLTAIAGNGCEDSLFINVEIDTVAPKPVIVDGIITCSQPFVELEAFATVSDSYNWAGPNGFEIDSSSFRTGTPGLYISTVTAENGCATVTDVVISADTIRPLVQAIEDTLSCNDSTITISASTNIGNPLIQWQGPGGFGSNDLSPEVGEVGTYILSITADNGCVGIDSAIVFADQDAPIAAVSGGTINCLFPQIPLQATVQTANAVSEWSGPGGFSSALLAPTIDQPGLYTLNVVATNGCEAEFSALVDIDTVSPNIVLLGDTLSCSKTSTLLTPQLTADSLVSTNWQGPNGFSSSLYEPTIDMPGMYSLIVTDKNGCQDDETVMIEEDLFVPIITFDPDTIKCNVSQSSVNSSTSSLDYSYDWSGPFGFTSSVPSPKVNAAGVYRMELEVERNGCRDTFFVDVPADTVSPVIVTVGDTLDCVKTVGRLDVVSNNGTLIYAWQGPGGFQSNVGSPSVSSFGVYTVIVTAENGCTSQETATVEADTLSPDLITFGAHLNCNNPIQNITASTDNETSVQWTLNMQAIGQGDTLSVDESGVYTAIATADNGCTSLATTEVTEDFEKPDFSVQGDTINCIKVTGELLAFSAMNGISYSWNGPAGFSALGATADVQIPGTYSATATGMNGCESALTVFLRADTLRPIAIAVVDGELNCVVEEVNVSSKTSYSTFPFSKSWENSLGQVVSSQSDIKVKSAGKYLLRLTHTHNGCESIDTVEVVENTDRPSSIDALALAPACPGGLGSIEIDAVIGGAAPYTFFVNEHEVIDLKRLLELNTGAYSVRVVDSIGCHFDTTLTIPEAEPLLLTMPESFIINFTESAQLLPEVNFPEQEIQFIEWTPSAKLSCSDCLRPYVDSLYETRFFDLYLIKEGGCELRGRVTVFIKKDRHVYFPNIFSPINKDGVNDYFFPTARLEEIVEVRSMAIFDRWGERIFEQRSFQPNDPTKGWDGLFNGTDLNPGVYVYFAEIEFIDGEVILYKGDVTLAR